MKLKWRKWFRFIHRDFGYLFFGMTIIYSLSGIAINHIRDWNPNYVVNVKEFQTQKPLQNTPEDVKRLLEELGENEAYKKHYSPSENYIKIFIENGSVTVNQLTGYGIIEKTRPRYVFKPMNYLHYNPVKWWTWFSDIFAGALIVIAITGLFILKGKTGITGRGAWLTIAGIIIPLIFLFVYYY